MQKEEDSLFISFPPKRIYQVLYVFAEKFRYRPQRIFIRRRIKVQSTSKKMTGGIR